MEKMPKSHTVNSTGYTVGLGLTDRCTANCRHCYSRPRDSFHELDLEQIRILVDSIPIKSINLGTGESILYPRFAELIGLLIDRQIPVAVTTNGATVRNLSDHDLKLFHDVDFSLDFPDPARNDDWRGFGSFQAVKDGIRRCQELGVEASLVTCLMRENCAYLGKLAEMAVAWNVNLRVNVYKPVLSRQHQASYHQFWQAIKDMAQAAYFTACSEPIVNAAIGNGLGRHGSPCGNMSFRVQPDGKIASCVYLRDGQLTLKELLSDFEVRKTHLEEAVHLPLPEVCVRCEHVQTCQGGCSARRQLSHPGQPDDYCFVVKQDLPDLKAQWKPSRDLVHENYLCTMIFSG
jgi:radical SAM protein with 4Fe4S-binding SPASM domain